MRYHEVALEVCVESPPAEGPQRRHTAPTLARLVGARIQLRVRVRVRVRARVKVRGRVRPHEAHSAVISAGGGCHGKRMSRQPGMTMGAQLACTWVTKLGVG